MIPPTFLEIIQNIPKGVFDQLKRHRREKYQFDVPTDEGLKEPTKKMSKCKEIKARVV
jgi:hypothetical protein